MNYDRNDLILAFRARSPDVNNPSENTLAKFDEQLFRSFDEEIRKQAPRAGIPLTEFNVSKLAVYATLSGGRTPATQVGFACVYFDAVRPQPPAVAIPPAPLSPVEDEIEEDRSSLFDDLDSGGGTG